MRRFACLASCLISLAFASPSMAVDQRGGVSTKKLRIDYGWVRDADGTKRSIKGLEVPFTIERIDAVRIKRRVGKTTHVSPSAFERLLEILREPIGNRLVCMAPAPRPFATTVYNADSGIYAVVDPNEFDDPSSLDDLSLSNGMGKKWENFTFGVDVASPGDVLTFRFRCFNAFNSSAPAGTNAFSSEFADWGFHGGPGFALTFANPGTYKITIPVTLFNITSPSNTVYLAQQMRHPNGTPPTYFNDDGEGAFNGNYRNVYSTGSAPTVGGSSNGFWFDWDPQNGEYGTDEFDVLSTEPTIFSNHLRTITAEDGGGVTDTLVPFSVTFPVGFNPLGTFVDLWNADDAYVSIQRGITLSPSVAPMQIEMEGLAQATTATNLKFKVEAGTSTGGSTQRTYLFNYTTNQYDLVDTRTSTTADSSFEVNITSNPARYINQTNKRVKSLVTFTAIITLNNQWRARIDQANWIVTR